MDTAGGPIMTVGIGAHGWRSSESTFFKRPLPNMRRYISVCVPQPCMVYNRDIQGRIKNFNVGVRGCLFYDSMVTIDILIPKAAACARVFLIILLS